MGLPIDNNQFWMISTLLGYLLFKKSPCLTIVPNGGPWTSPPPTPGSSHVLLFALDVLLVFSNFPVLLRSPKKWDSFTRKKMVILWFQMENMWNSNGFNQPTNTGTNCGQRWFNSEWGFVGIIECIQTTICISVCLKLVNDKFWVYMNEYIAYS